MRHFFQCIFIAGGFLFTSTASYCQPGKLDSTFATNGIGNYGGTFRQALTLKDLVVKSDQSILLVGEYAVLHPTQGNYSHYFTLLRTDLAGSEDYTFGQDLTFVNNLSAGANRIVLQPDNKIIAAGFSGLYESSSDFAMARFLPDGDIDSSFGTYGKVITDFGSDVGEEAVDLLLQADGKIIVIGNSGGSYTEKSKLALARYRSNGTLDSSFGFKGKSICLLFPDLSNYATTASLQVDGKILIGGYSKNGFGFITRVDASGSLDSTFGLNAIKLLDGDQIVSSTVNGSAVKSLKVQRDGKIVVCGIWDSTSSSGQVQHGGFVIRLVNAGALDTSFASGGKMVFPKVIKDDWYAPTTTDLNSLALQEDGKIIVAGTSYFLDLIRLNSNGTLDTSFNKTGVVHTYVNHAVTQGSSRIVITGDEKIISLGVTQNPTQSFMTRHFAAVNNYYWVGGTGNWSDYSHHWSTSSGGTIFHSHPPSFINNVIFDVNSFKSNQQTVTIDAPAYCNHLIWTGVSDNPALIIFPGIGLTVYGSLIK